MKCHYRYIFWCCKLHFDESSLLNQPSFSTARKPLLLLLARIVMVMHSVDHIFETQIVSNFVSPIYSGYCTISVSVLALCSLEDFYHDKP